MAGKTKLVDDLILDVRSLIDEENQSAVDDDRDILPALNRAQDYAANILARHYESPLLKYEAVQLQGNKQEYDIPRDAMEQRLEKVEIKNGIVYYPLKRIDYRDLTLYETSSKINIPYFYCVIGDKFRLIPGPTNNYQLRLWYLYDPLPLVKQQGRVTLVNEASNYLLLDEIGQDLTTETDNLDSYVNVLDGQTGRVKCSMQVKSLNGNKVEFKSTPMRLNVLDLPISDSLATLTDNEGLPVHVAPDDYVCLLKGVCIPFFKKPVSNFLIAHAVAEIKVVKLGGEQTLINELRKEMETEVERSWVGREATLVVKRSNATWQSFLWRFRGY